jgi:hypothetical protein
MAHVVIRLPSSAEARDRSQASLCEICGVLNGSDVGFFRVRRFSTVSAPYSFIYHRSHTI